MAAVPQLPESPRDFRFVRAEMESVVAQLKMVANSKTKAKLLWRLGQLLEEADRIIEADRLVEEGS